MTLPILRLHRRCGGSEVSNTIVGVSRAAQRTGGSDNDVLNASGELGAQSDNKKKEDEK